MLSKQDQQKLLEILNNCSKNHKDYRPEWGLDDMGDVKDNIPAVKQLFDRLFNFAWDE